MRSQDQPIPGVASAQCVSVEPDLDARSAKGVAVALRHIDAFEGVAKQHRPRRCTRPYRRLPFHHRPLDLVWAERACLERRSQAMNNRDCPACTERLVAFGSTQLTASVVIGPPRPLSSACIHPLWRAKGKCCRIRAPHLPRRDCVNACSTSAGHGDPCAQTRRTQRPASGARGLEPHRRRRFVRNRAHENLGACSAGRRAI